MGNSKLLAVKLALEERRHWLEGVEKPFTVWTNHKNLAYIQSAKRLNPRQARWALFFSRFNFTLTFRPGSRNTKPDALSRLYSSEESHSIPDHILPTERIVAHFSWGIERTVREAQRQQPDPGNGPLNLLFVPDSVRSQVLQWAHTSRFACHPGSNHTIALLRRHFWWPTMDQDTREYARPLTRLPLVYSGHCPSPVGPGHILLLTLLLVSLYLRVTPLF